MWGECDTGTRSVQSPLQFHERAPLSAHCNLFCSLPTKWDDGKGLWLQSYGDVWLGGVNQETEGRSILTGPSVLLSLPSLPFPLLCSPVPSRSAADAFRSQVIGAKKTGVPIIYLDKCSFMYSRVGDVYIVAVTKQNANAALVFQFIYKMVDVFRAYFGGAFDEENCRQNFVLIYELLDECCDHGYPQITAINILTSYIQVANVKAQDSVRGTHKHARKGDGDGATGSKRINVGRIVGGALALSIRRALCESLLNL